MREHLGGARRISLDDRHDIGEGPDLAGRGQGTRLPLDLIDDDEFEGFLGQAFQGGLGGGQRDDLALRAEGGRHPLALGGRGDADHEAFIRKASRRAKRNEDLFVPGLRHQETILGQVAAACPCD